MKHQGLTAPLPINLTDRLAELGADLSRTIPELSHIDPQRVLYTLVRSRAKGTHGTYARIVPMRFGSGTRELTRRRGRFHETYRMPSLIHDERDILYLIQVMVPRFLRLSFAEKLRTLIHELYHISELCDGDIRRFPGRNFAHGPSRSAYNRIIDALAERYLAGSPPDPLLGCLDLDEERWLRREIRLTGLTLPLPRPVLVARRRA